MSLALLRRCTTRMRAFSGSLPARSQLRQSLHCRATASQADDKTGLAPPDVKSLAKLASITVSDEEVAAWEPKIQSTVAWFDQLQAADLEGVEPATHPFIQQLPLRQDTPQDYSNRQELLQQAPDKSESYVKVPRITVSDSAAKLPDSTPAAAAATPAPAAAELPESDVSLLAALDIRVGLITECSQHPDADTLYVETIDTGDAEPRTIVSGLKKYVPLEEMQNRPVLVLCNLKPRNMRGIKSFGMLLAASNPEHTVVEPLAPPAGSKPGDRIFFGAHSQQAEPWQPNQIMKKKVWEEVQPNLSVDGAGQATFKGAAMSTAAGVVTAATIVNGKIS